MPPPELHQSLVVMLAMRLPDAGSAKKSQGKRYAGISDKRKENEQREPKRPPAVAPSRNTRNCGQKTQRYRAYVTEKYARRRCISNQKRCRSGGESKKECGIVCASPRGGGGIRAETDDRHYAGKTVAPIHEVVQIGHPHDRDHRCDRIHDRIREPNPQNGCTRVDREAHSCVHAASIIPEGYSDHDE